MARYVAVVVKKKMERWPLSRGGLCRKVVVVERWWLQRDGRCREAVEAERRSL